MRTQPRITEIACRVLALSALIGILFVIGCAGGGTQGSNPPPVTYTIGGTVSGLSGTGLVLQNNGGNNLSVSANATASRSPRPSPAAALITSRYFRSLPTRRRPAW